MAVDACIELNQWSRAVQLAEKYELPTISSYLAKYVLFFFHLKRHVFTCQRNVSILYLIGLFCEMMKLIIKKKIRYANHLVERDIPQAIELYQKAEYFAEAAKLLNKLANQAGREHNYLRAKKLSVLAAVAIDKYKNKALDSNQKNMVDVLLSADKVTVTDRTLDSAWRGAEAYHYFLLAQKQLIEQHNVERAMVTAMRLSEYDDILDEVDLYSLIALTTYLNKSYSLCSKAFIRLETIEARGGKRGDNDTKTDTNDKSSDDLFSGIDSKRGNVWNAVGALTKKVVGQGTLRSQFSFDFEQQPSPFQDLAIKIFTRHPPVDSSPGIPCWKCKADTKEWFSSCQSCNVTFNVCVVSGRTIQHETGSADHRVEVCKKYVFILW